MYVYLLAVTKEQLRGATAGRVLRPRPTVFRERDTYIYIYIYIIYIHIIYIYIYTTRQGEPLV